MSYRVIIHRHALLGTLLLIGSVTRESESVAEAPRGADCAASELLPISIAACAEVADLGVALDTVLNHPLRAKLEALPAYESLMASDAPEKLQMGVRAFEASMGQPWQKTLATLTDRGITVAFDRNDGGAAILIHSSDADLLERFRGFILAVRQMQGGKSKQADYRDFVADLINDDVKMVRMHDWLLLTNNSELGKSIIDQYLDRDGETLSSRESYRAAKKSMESQSGSSRHVTAFVDLQALRDAGVAKELFNERVDNFVGEAVVGGVLANTRRATYATGQIRLDAEGVSLQVATPHQRDWESPREYFFGEPELAAAPPLLDVPDRVFALSTHRDLSQLWLRSGDMLTEKGVDQLAVADTALTTFFSGRDFGEDILGSLESGIQIVGMKQDFTDVRPQPAIKLPAFALRFRMKTPEETEPELRRVFQSFVGFLNITGAQNGQPQFDLGMETVGDVQFNTATYVPDRDKRESLDLPIQFNFSPTLAFAGDRIVLSSTTSLARILMESPVNSQDDGQSDFNTHSKIEAASLRQILESNRSQLVANSMLEKGHGKEAAEGEIDFLLELVGFFRDVRLNLDVTDSQMTLNLAVKVQQ